ncbi:MAG: hypothetical protein U9Q33_03360 [Campylobacterota bacterium]|nr:hypothetical protein [Campylobacterota bacterium]
MAEDTIPSDIIKIQKKLATFEKGSRNYNKYSKILKKHVKNYNMKKRVVSHIKTIEHISEVVEKNEMILKENITSLTELIKKVDK